MRKSTIFAFLAAAAFTTASAKADCGACGSKQETKASCHISSAKLDLTEEQASQLAALQAECKKEGCTKAACEKMLKGAEAILSAEQFAKVKETCEKACAASEESEKPQT